MFDLAFFHRKKLALDPVVLTQEPPTSKGFGVPAIDAQGNKGVTYINAPIFVEFAFFAHYGGLQDRRALGDDVGWYASLDFTNERISFPESHSRGVDKELGSLKHFEVIIKNPQTAIEQWNLPRFQGIRPLSRRRIPIHRSSNLLHVSLH